MSKHAIIIVKNNKNEYLQYYEDTWQSYLFLNCKVESANDVATIEDYILEKLGVKVKSIEYLFTKKHSKYSVKHQKMREYEHFFFSVELPEILKMEEPEFVINNLKFKWFSMKMLESDLRIQEVNGDIVGFVKENLEKTEPKRGKVVILCGNKRAGKTTLSVKLNKEYNFTHLNMDQILDAVDFVCDEKNIKHFIDCYAFFEKLVDFACQNAKDYGESTVIEYIFKISDIEKLKSKYDIEAYALYTDTNEENLRKILKEYSKPFDWPVLVGDDDFNRNIKEILDKNRELKLVCQNSVVHLIDTGYGKSREEIIDNLARQIGTN